MATPDLQLTFRDGGSDCYAGDAYTGLDRFGRLVETLWQVPGSGDARVQSQYGRNRVGGVVWRRDEAAHAQSVDTEDNYYWYDGLQQIKERQRGNLIGTAPDYTGIDNLQQEEDWTYDATGNWQGYEDSNPANAQARTHNEANEITEIAPVPSGTPVEPAYDTVGNMLTLPKEPGVSTDQYDLQWDAWNRLVAVEDGSTLVASYTYDGLTRRLTKTNESETRHYYYNKDWRAVEERVEGASTAVDRQYVWGLRDRWDLVQRKRSVSGSLDEVLYVLRDYLDPVALADDSGTVVERFAYDAFGGVRFLAPDYSARSASDFEWNFLFHAEFRDIDTGLYNYGYRYYDTKLGRWLSRDPIWKKSGFHLFAFVVNQPLIGRDYYGLSISLSSSSNVVYSMTQLEAGTLGAVGLPTFADIEVQIEEVGDSVCSLTLYGTLQGFFVSIDADQISNSNHTVSDVIAHEGTHVKIWQDAWDTFATYANSLEGNWCPCKCATLASKVVTDYVYLSYLKGLSGNLVFDITEYGYDSGGKTLQELNHDLSIANNELTTALKEFDDDLTTLSAVCTHNNS